MNRISNFFFTPTGGVAPKIFKQFISTTSYSASTCHSMKMHHFHNNIKTIYKTNYLSNRINNYFSKTKLLNNMINNLANFKNDSDFDGCRTILENCSINLDNLNLNDINNILHQEYVIIINSLNNSNYYKHTLLSTDILTAYLIIWQENAETDIHYHASNGCYVLNFQGEWEETIYKNICIDDNIIKTTRKLKPGDITYISNYGGMHQVNFLGNCDLIHYPKAFGLSINIYSPTNEL